MTDLTQIPVPNEGPITDKIREIYERSFPPEEQIPLPTSLFGDRNSFLLTVRGDSMINAGIFDGDTLLVREQSTADNGDIVVAMLDDGATVKSYYRERDCIRLQPHNDAMEPIFTTDAHILGIVTGLFRSY